MNLNDYLPVLVQVIIALAIAAGVIGASHFFGQKTKSNSLKDSAYECGLEAASKGGSRFSVKFYVVAMLFIVFDIEIVFLVPWTQVYRQFLQLGIPILMPVLFFLTVLVVGLVYEYKRGGLEWDK